jgi:hypothetical protein
MSRAMKGVLALLFVGGGLMLAGAVWSYVDEHSGESAQAKVTDCYSRGRGKYSTVFCNGTWTVNDRRMTGNISNGRLSDEGKTLSVRVHGKRATKPTLWISIGLAVMGAFVLATGVMVLRQLRRSPPKPA